MAENPTPEVSKDDITLENFTAWHSLLLAGTDMHHLMNIMELTDLTPPQQATIINNREWLENKFLK